MSRIRIDVKTCTVCGKCASVCGRRVLLFDSQKGIMINPEAECSLCGHCMAICPEEALSHAGIDQTKAEVLSGDEKLNQETFIRFVKSRRSHRHFKTKPVPRELIEASVNICRYCPTGANSMSVGVMAITSAEFINQLAGLCIEHFRRALQDICNEVEAHSAGEHELSPQIDSLRQRVPKLKGLIKRWEEGNDPILHSAPVVLLFHADPLVTTPKDDCVIAAQTVALYARTFGLESCYIGLLEKAFWGYEPVRKAVDLPDENGLYSVMIMGWPLRRYLRSVERKSPQLIWR